MLERVINLTDRTRLIVVAVAVLVILSIINIEIVGKQRILSNGTTVLLRLAPVDPRSLLQGDYMALRYALSGRVADAADEAQVSDGLAVITLDDEGAAEFVRIHNGQELLQSELLLRFRKRGESVRLASDAFFFEEGSWDEYRGARYGELRVSRNGSAVLIGLRDIDGQPMGEQLHP